MRRYQFDGLRFFLFMCVFTTHHFPTRVEYLGYALPVFFVMSGFLITQVLLSADDPGLLARLRVFYLRRILRIFPAYYTFVALLLVFGSLSFPWTYLLYLVNIKWFALSVTMEPGALVHWFGGHWRTEHAHLWSLSVEEQFYIVYPLLLYLTAPRWRTAMFALLLAGSIAARFWFMKHYPQSYYSALLPVCAEYFIWGCAFAWWQDRERLGWLRPVPVFYLASAGVIALIAVEFTFGLDGYYQFRTSHFQTPVAALLGLAIWGLWNMPRGHWLVRFLSLPPFTYLGEMSYAMYLVHLVSWGLWPRLGIDLPWSRTVDFYVGTLALTVLMSMAMWHFIERPADRLKRFIPYTHPRRPPKPSA